MLEIAETMINIIFNFWSANSVKMFFSKEDKILIKNLRHLKWYTATSFLREFKTKNWTRGRLKTLLGKIDALDPLIVWLAVAVPALPLLLATSPLSGSGVVILALVSGHTGHTSSINSHNFEMNGVLYKLIEV